MAVPNRVRGMDAELIFAKASGATTPLLHWTDFQATRKIGEFDDPSAGAEFDQFSDGRRRADGTISGYVGGAENPDDLPQPGDVIQTLSMEVITGDELLAEIADETKYGLIKVTEVDYTQKDDPGKWTIKFRSGGRVAPV